MKLQRILAFTLAGAFLAGSAVAGTIDLGGPATGYLAIANAKNSATQYGIEGKDSMGNPNPGHNGLPDYPNFSIPAGYTNANLWTAIIASPQSAASDYAPFSQKFYGNTPIMVNNRTVTDANFSTMSAGVIKYSDSLLIGVGTEVIGVNDLTFNFDTYEWNGVTANGWPVSGPRNISPFSPIYTEYNDAGGAGNAAFLYNISLSNVTGSGLTFQNGVLTSMDIDGDLAVMAASGYGPTASVTFNGGFSASGLNYAFDVADTKSVFVFSGINMIFNRAGTASQVVPEPSTALLAGIAGVVACGMRRRK